MSSLAIVTGATQGIGRAVAEVLAREFPGSGVLLVCRNQGRGQEAVQEIRSKSGNQQVLCEVCDVSKWEQVCVLLLVFLFLFLSLPHVDLDPASLTPKPS